jgi:hypothetical protein
MRNAPAFVSAILLALIFIDWPGSGYFLSGASLIVFGPAVATRVAEAALWCLGAIMDACRASAAREVVRIAAIAALATAAITGAVSAGYAAEPANEPPFFVTVESYINSATALPDMSEADRAALRSVLRPIVEAARDGCK